MRIGQAERSVEDITEGFRRYRTEIVERNI